MSGIYDTLSCTPERRSTSPTTARTRKGWGPASCMAGLINTRDPADADRVASSTPRTSSARRRSSSAHGAWRMRGYPEMHYLAGHNHLSPAQSIGTEVKSVERMVAGFVRRVTR